MCPHSAEGSRFSIHQMVTCSERECRASLRCMTFREALSSLYLRSKGSAFLLGVKWRGVILINPSGRIKNSNEREEEGGETCPRHIGDCEAVFLMAPSWESAWELMTEEDDTHVIRETFSFPFPLAHSHIGTEVRVAQYLTL